MHVAKDEDYRQTLADRAAARGEAAGQPREEVAWVEDLDASGVPARLYVPAGADDRAPYKRGLIVHLHGGGFVFNDVEVHDAPARRLANRTGRSVLSVDYRLAPEAPFPAAVRDVDHAILWAASQTRFVAAHGDSAGANLAVGAALRHPGLVSAVVAIYPFLDPTSGFDSYSRTGGSWERSDAQWLWSQYLDLASDPDLVRHPDVAPLTSPDLHRLPPTLVLTAEDDIARDEGEHLHRLLAEQGVRVRGSRVLGVPHGFWRSDAHGDAADLVMLQTGAFLDLISGPAAGGQPDAAGGLDN